MEPVDFDQISIPVCVSVEKIIRTQRNISAIRIERMENGSARLGALSEIPSGVQIEVCGAGFNDRTVKARYAEDFFFVYLQDIDTPVSSMPE